jgi:hypothetical protein
MRNSHDKDHQNISTHNLIDQHIPIRYAFETCHLSYTIIELLQVDKIE